MWLTEVSLLVRLARVAELLEAQLLEAQLLETHSLMAQLLVGDLVLRNDKIKLTDGFSKKCFYG